MFVEHPLAPAIKDVPDNNIIYWGLQLSIDCQQWWQCRLKCTTNTVWNKRET